MKWDGSTLILSTGKQLYAYGEELLAIDAKGELCYGHDGICHVQGINDLDLTAVEKAEIADHMILRWQRWRDAKV